MLRAAHADQNWTSRTHPHVQWETAHELLGRQVQARVQEVPPAGGSQRVVADRESSACP